MIKALSASLSLRLLGIFIVTALLIVTILIGLFTKGLSGQWARSIRPHLAQYVQYVQQDLGSPPRPERADALAQRLPVDIHIYKDDQRIHATTSKPLALDSLDFEPIGRLVDQRRGKAHKRVQPNPTMRVAITRHQGSQRILRIEENGYRVYYDLNESRRRSGRGRGYNDELIVALGLIGLVLLSSYLLIRWQLSPIRQIQKGVGVMSDGALDHRIERRGDSDLDELAKSIDAMAARLQAMLDAKRQLLIALSHELRSPITRARLNTELLPESRHRIRLLEDLSDMERMIRDIMESEQLQANHSVLNRENLDIEKLLRDELSHIAPDLSLQVESNNENTVINGDAARLRILLRNLVTNALQHGQSSDGQSRITVTLVVTTAQTTVTIADQGAGINRTYLDEVSDPFYRPDPSRSRATGGFGMGLTLARLIAQAHAGTLTIDSDPDTCPGTRVTVVLPQ